MPSAGQDSDEPLYERDPQAWHRYLAEGNRRQARKRVSVEVLIHDASGRILLVDPSYKPDWDIPGGMVEANEPPIRAAQRELAEELGLTVPIGRLLCIDWSAPHGPWDDLLTFVFEGGPLTSEEASSLRFVDGELISAEFCDYAEARRRLRDYVWRRTSSALEAKKVGTTVHTHNGARI
ncbi:NUDIX domain-containing protein [Marinitenerispora sediminis]|uniref:NUDIX hydrolase n=1 Tax=Marinitenerispora sediminis TaxID=1931232 RepID=A0A368TA33_9ACTN|nr:NUDIX hydrolase [Marinitenerispora sediminis]RCV58130.1 NUDIX hydrolase [Marinitenerispora sediminis]RCV58752.1 NUDIX hydrolase [Marinitenerispora sediminis]RCV61403.1 NUDIX hydrolase [Marinitenerispora sediminis]